MKKVFFVFFLFIWLFTLLLFSLQLNISVSDSTGIKLVGTNVSIFEGQRLLNSTKTSIYQKWGEDAKALANFELNKGVYFLVVERSYFSPAIFLLDLNSDYELNVVLIQNSSTYTLYGKLQNSQDFIGKKLSVLDKKGKIVSNSKIHKDGYFLLNYLYPSEDYRLAILEEPKTFGQYFSYSSPGVYYLEPDLKNEEEFEVKNLSLFSPEKIEVGKKIVALLKLGENPLKNQKIILTLPSKQKLELLTDELGQVAINAAEAGNYIFEYNNTFSNTLAYEVELPQTPSKKEEENKQSSDFQILQNVEKEDNLSKSPIQPNKGFSSTKSEFGVIFLLISTIIFSIFIFILLYIFFFRKTKN
ncbi:MAG: hypothetical protein ACK4J0_04055 [Candidatus Anstonellaceae archaeon]